MRLLFIYTPKQKLNKLCYVNKMWRNYSNESLVLPPLGIAYLSSYLNRQDYKVKILDANVLNLKINEILDEIKSYMPDYILYSLVTDSFQDTLEWVDCIKLNTNIPTIVGGPHMSIYPKETLTHDSIDYGVVGDGWISLNNLIKALRFNTDLSKVRGICYKTDKDIILTKPQKCYFTLEEVPLPARDMLPNEKYKNILSLKRPITTMISAMGCPYNCTYCCTDTNVRMRPAEHVAWEVEVCIKKYGIQEIEFYDETFTVDKKRVNKFLDIIENKNLKFLWSIRTRADCVDRDLVLRMGKLGCIRMNVGIESGDEQILKEIKRNIPLSQIKKVIEWAREAKITFFGYFMLGLPHETVESIEKTINLMMDLNPDYVQINKFAPMPNSEIYNEIVRVQGYDFWKEYTLGNVTFNDYKPYNLYVTEEELDHYVLKGYKQFYFRPKFIYNKIKSLRSFDELIMLSKAALSLRGG